MFHRVTYCTLRRVAMDDVFVFLPVLLHFNEKMFIRATLKLIDRADIFRKVFFHEKDQFFGVGCRNFETSFLRTTLEPGLHLHVNKACEQEPRMNVWYICTLFDIRQGSEYTLHKCIVCEFPLMYRQLTDSIWSFAKRLSHSRMLFASPW